MRAKKRFSWHIYRFKKWGHSAAVNLITQESWPLNKDDTKGNKKKEGEEST